MRQIKLVATDIDGTIIPQYHTEIPPIIFEEAEKLISSGISFCFASGRQYQNLQKIAAPLLEKAYFMCENGAVVFTPGKEPKLISKTEMEREDSQELIRMVMNHPDCEVFASGEQTMYICPKKLTEKDLDKHILDNSLLFLQSPEEIPEPIVKVSAFCRNAAAVRPALAEHCSGKFTVSVAGDNWVDITVANKGTGLSALCDYLGIGLNEVAAFGDNYNDLPMLSLAGRPYIMENADENLKKIIPNHCRDVVEEIRKILRENET